VTSINKILNAWYTSNDEVLRFGRDLLDGGMFDADSGTYDRFGFDVERTTASNLLNFFEKPHHWDREHAWWVANDWPDDVKSWERGLEAKWEITHD